MSLVACATRHRTPTRSTKASSALVSDTASARRDSVSTLEQLRSFLGRDSLSGDSLGRLGRQGALGVGDSSVARDSLGHIIDSLVDSLGEGKELDSLRQAQRRTDSLEAVRKRKASEPFDDIIAYKAQDSMVLLGQNLAYLFGPSTVDYKDKGLEGNFMRMNTDSSLIFAHYTIDSAGKATAFPSSRTAERATRPRA